MILSCTSLVWREMDVTELCMEDLEFKPTDALSYAYLIRAGETNTYKIGKAKNPLTQISELQSSSSEVLSLIAFSIGGSTLETFLHTKFKAHTKIGEWYVFDHKDLETLLTVFKTINSTRIRGLTLETSEHKFTNLLKSFHNTERENLGAVMVKGPGQGTEAYPECPSPQCWCYDCATNTMRPTNFGKEDYDRERHKKRAMKWAENTRKLWGWELILELQARKPFFEVEAPNMVALERYHRNLQNIAVNNRLISTEIMEAIAQNALAEKHKDNVKVIAKWITRDEIAFECPFCWTRFSINGEPYKGAKRVIHYHKNIIYSKMSCHEIGCKKKNCLDDGRHFKSGFEDNFIIYRIPHCSRSVLNSYYITKGNISPFPRDGYNLFAIHVTDHTQRILKLNKKKE